MRYKLQFETDKEKIISGRVSRDFQGNKYYNCDVCWTCRAFDMESSACTPYYKCGPNLKARADYPRGDDCIIRPDVYRCSFWKEKE